MSKNTHLLQLMHDAVGPANRVKQLAEMIQKDPTNGSVKASLEMIIKCSDDINAALDKFYNSNQKIHY